MKTGLYKFKSAGSSRRRGEWEWIEDYWCSAADSVTCYCVWVTKISNGSHFICVTFQNKIFYSLNPCISILKNRIFIFLGFFCLCKIILKKPADIFMKLTSLSFLRTQASWTCRTSASTSTTPRVTWTLIGPFRSAWRQTSPSSCRPLASPARSPPPWLPWLDVSHSPTLRYLVSI